MKKISLCATLLVFWAAPAWTQTTEELVNDGKNTENVTTQSMGYDRKSYSPLKQINQSNVKRLVPIWSTSLMNDQGELAAPTIYNGVMYVINGKWTFAIDVETGRQIWRYARAQTVNVYTAWPESLSQPIFKAYTAKTGVPINFIRLSTGELVARATAERNNPRADVIWGAPGDRVCVPGG